MKKLKNYLPLLLMLFFLFQSCEKDEVVQLEETISFPKLKGKIVSVEELLRKPELENKIVSLSNGYSRKSTGSNSIQIDTTHIEMIESDQFTSYTFAIVQDSIEKQSVLRNYMLTIVNDSLQVQSLVSYPVLSNQELDMQNINFEQVWGDSLITQTRFKCGGTQTSFYSYEDCYNYNCHGNTGDGTHGIGDNNCKASAGDRAGTNCVIRWASFTYQEAPCETIGAGPSSGGGGGGSGGGGTTNPPTNNPPVDLTIPLSPIGNLEPVDNAISRIHNQLTLTPEQTIFLNQPENSHITDAVDEYLDEQALTINEEGKQALRDAIDVLSGEKTVSDLDSIIDNTTYIEIAGKSLSNLKSDEFEELGEALTNYDPDEILSLSELQLVSQRVDDVHAIVNTQKNDLSYDPAIGDLNFSFAQQDQMQQHLLFVGFLPEVKKLIEEYLPQTAEEWKALLEIMEPILWETLIEFIPGGGIAIAINDIVQEMQVSPPDAAAITISIVSIVAEFIPFAKIAKTAAKTFKNILKAFKIYDRVSAILPLIRKIYKKGIKVDLDGDEVKLLKNNDGLVPNGQSSKKVIATGDDVERVALNIADEVNDRQRTITNQWESTIGSQSNKRKGNFGEMKTDLDLAEEGYIPLHTRIDDIDASGHNGIDAVMEKDGQYFIIESKYSSTTTPSLNPANASTGLPKQMSDNWIQRPGELENTIGDPVLAQQILNSNYTRVLATHGPNGNLIYKLVDSNGVIGNVWTP